MKKPNIREKMASAKMQIKWTEKCVLLISLLALVTTLYEGRQNRIHRELSVKPMVTFTTSFFENDPMFDFVGVRIENRGIGPALLLPMHFYIKGEYIGSNDFELADPMLKSLNVSQEAKIYRIHRGHVLQPREERKVIWVQSNGTTAASRERVKSLLNELDILVCYDDLYDRRFVNSLKSRDPEVLAERKKKCISSNKIVLPK